MKYFIPAALLLLLLICGGCGKSEKKGMSAADSLKIELQMEIDSLEAALALINISYSLTGKKESKTLIEEYGNEGFGIILALNRVDARNLRRADTLVVPDTILSDFRLYSPFPLEVPEAYDIERIIFVSQRIQAFAAYEYGNLVRWGPTSTGKRSTPTPNGLFHTNWKAKETISTVDDEWILKWNFNVENFEGISLHQYEMPGYPASHACARLYAEDAMWIYNWAEQWILTPDGNTRIAYGTPVIIFGSYNYESPRIWRRLADAPESATIMPGELSELMDKYQDIILERQQHRELIIAERDSLKKLKEEEAALKN